MNVTKEKFRPSTDIYESIEETRTIEDISIKHIKSMILSNKIMMISIIILITYIVMAIVGPFLIPYDYKTTDLSNVNKWPNSEHWFGTDELGRDLWQRTWVGARVSIFIGIISGLIQTIVGAFVGGMSGLLGGKVDNIIMRCLDIISAIPYTIITILIMVVMGSGIILLIIAISITSWIDMARLVRGQIIQLKNLEYIMSAKLMGASNLWILFKHLLPNCIWIIIIQLTISIPEAIFSEAYLSFLGIGIKPPMASWGLLANLGIKHIRTHPYQLVIPGILISVFILAMNILGDGFRDAFDPTLNTVKDRK